MSNLYGEDFRIGEIKNTSRYASVSYKTSKKADWDSVEMDQDTDNMEEYDDLKISGSTDNITDKSKSEYCIHSDKIITFNMKMLLCAQIVLCIIFTFMALEFSKKPENFYDAKKIYGALQNSSGVHKFEESLITAKNDLLKEK